MNEQHATTAPAVAPDFEKAFDALEGPIAVNAGRAKAIDWFVGSMMDRHKDENGRRAFHEGEMEILYYLARDLFEASKALDEQWQEAA